MKYLKNKHKLLWFCLDDERLFRKINFLNVFHAHCVLIQLIEVRINIFSIWISIQRWWLEKNLKFKIFISSACMWNVTNHIMQDITENFLSDVCKMEKLSNWRSILIIKKRCNRISQSTRYVWLYTYTFFTHPTDLKTSIGNYIPLEISTKISIWK